jgi:predicted ATPase/DNA-binding SARP family transcriptional activator
VRIALLGPLEVQRDGRAEPPGGRRLEALLARLALDCGRVVSASALIDAVWEDALPADPSHALQTLVSRLRRSLPPGVLVQEAGGYRLDLAPEQVDAIAFERLVQQNRLDEALELWRGPALAGLTGEYRFATAAAARLEDVRVRAQADRIGAELARGDGAAKLAEIEALLAEHPLDERLAAHRITALAAAGRPADALAAYEEIRRRLDDELGAIPSPELQAAHAAVLRGDAGKASPPPAHRSNLPHARSSFVGRQREVEDLSRLLDEHRLVTLIGTGGSGKTRLAIEVARGRRGDAWIAELASVTEPEHVTGAVLDALGLREARLLESQSPIPPDAEERLVGALTGDGALLVLDNCEHLIEAAAALADELLARCSGLRLIATSREPLAIAGEHLVAVAPLAFPAPDATAAQALAHPAVQLLADRGAAASPGFRVTDENVTAVTEICRRLDGLPLAIELAAARLRSLSPEQIAARLDDRFRLLTGGSRTALPRQRTLRAVIDWSWDLLSEPERALAARLAVFPGGVTPGAAAAVADGSDVIDLLAALVDRSLLQVADPDAPRYRMLETLREYGVDRLSEAGELAATKDAHAHHFAALAEEADPHLRRPEQIEWLARLNADRENMIAALRHLCDTGDARRALHMVVSMSWFWVLTGSQQEAEAAFRLAATVPGEADPLDRTIIEAITADREHQSHEEARETMIELLENLDREGLMERPLGVVVAPVLAMLAGQEERADRLFGEALAHPDPWVRAMVPLARAQIAENNGDTEGTRSNLQSAMAGFREVGDRWALAVALMSWGTLRTLEGDLADARRALEDARGLLAELNAGSEQVMLLLRLADVYARDGDLDGARELLARSRRQGSPDGEQAAISLAALAKLEALADPDRLPAVREELEATLPTTEGEAPGRTHGRAIVLNVLAALELMAGEDEAARERLAPAYRAAVESHDHPIIATVGVTVATANHRAGRPGDAAEILGAAARVRGGEDATSVDITALAAALREELGEDGYAEAVARGRGLGRDAAVARLDPASLTSGTARVGA